MKEIDQAVLPPGKYSCGARVGKTRVWAYETSDTDTHALLGPAHWPAVTIVARRHVPTRVTYVNQLPSFNPADPRGPGLVQGVLPFDQTLHWADPLNKGCGMPAMQHMSGVSGDDASCRQQYIGPVPAAVHLHGGELPTVYDGDPESWFTPNGLKGSDYHSLGEPKPGEAIYEYPNAQEAGTLWLHDHTLGTTRLNVYAGLAGFYFLKDPDLEPRGYPGGAYEIELALQDRLFDMTGQLYLPQQQPINQHPFWSTIFEGDVSTVNGAAFPYVDVEPRRYRFHILNGSNHRGYDLTVGDASDITKRAPIYSIGSDDNYFDAPVAITSAKGVHVSGGERADVIIDFSGFAGQTLYLRNGAGGMDFQIPRLMQFRVNRTVKTPDTSCDPAAPSPSTGLCARKTPMVHLTDGNGNVLPGVKIDKVRQLVISDYVNVPTTIKEFVNNTDWDGRESASIAHDFPTDGVSELPRVGSVELWEIANLAIMGTHPIHLHLTQVQVLNRQAMDTAKYLNDWHAAFGTGPAPLPPECPKFQYCPDYGPPLDYLTPNKDGALGGNPGFSGYYTSKTIMPPEPFELGWKDTVELNPHEVTRILVRWTPSDVPQTPDQSFAGRSFYAFDPTQGYYVWHCHIITHEDNEMMRPYRVTW